MAGSKFLNPRVKVLICLLGMGLMGYFLYPAADSGVVTDTDTILRGVVFLGFAYFFIKNVVQILKGPGSS